MTNAAWGKPFAPKINIGAVGPPGYAFGF